MFKDEDLKQKELDGNEYKEENIDETFEMFDDEDDLAELRNQRSIFVRFVALITAVAFLGLVIMTTMPAVRIPLADLIAESLRLEKDIDIQRLQTAVVKINVISRKQGYAAAVEQRSGTGFNIEPSGLIITNHHVIDGAVNMSITFSSGKVYKAEYWKSKPEFDLAVIKLKAADLPIVPINSEQPNSGDKIRVVGNPLGLNNIVVEGEFKRYLKVKDKPGTILGIDAPIFPGNSGSPVFDRKGKVIGVVFGSLHKQNDNQEEIVGLVIPIKEVMEWQSEKEEKK